MKARRRSPAPWAVAAGVLLVAAALAVVLVVARSVTPPAERSEASRDQAGAGQASRDRGGRQASRVRSGEPSRDQVEWGPMKTPGAGPKARDPERLRQAQVQSEIRRAFARAVDDDDPSIPHGLKL